MKKSLLAVAMTLATGGAVAQSNVTLYGIIDEGFIKRSESAQAPDFDGKTAHYEKNVNKFISGGNSANRFGFKSEEDLSDGLKAKANIEFGFGNGGHEQSPVHTLRQAWVGLSNADGHGLKIGRIQSQSYEILAETDASGSGKSVGSILSNRDTSLDSRQGVQYMFKQPNYGFGIGYYYHDKNEKTYTKNNDSSTTAASYPGDTSKGKKGQGYELSGHFDDGFVFGKLVYATGTLDRHDTEHDWPTNFEADRRLITTNFGVKLTPDVKVSYTYQNQKLVKSIWDANYADEKVKNTSRTEAHQLNLNYLLTPQVEVFTSYSYGLLNNELVEDINPIKVKGTGIQLGGRYHFSKRTSLYGIYGRESWKINTEVENFDPISIKAKRDSLAVGLKHVF